MTDTELKHIILHEMVHLKKRDNLRWILVLLIRAIHWFNPLVHLAAAEYKRSNEKYERVSQSLEKYFDNMKTILKEIGRGFFRTEPEEIIQLQKETGIDEWLEYNINMFKKLRDIQKK